MELYGRAVSVVGIGVENVPLVRYLARAGAKVTARDQKLPDQLGRHYQELTSLPVSVICGESYLEGIDKAEVIFLSPGIKRHLPEIEAARAGGAEITSQMALFLSLCPAGVAGITGSSGKTTTTTLIGKILDASGFRVFVGGNIGRPLIEHVGEMSPDDWVVLELSSFQLEGLRQSPHVALVTNVTPNHLDMHASMEEYIEAKAQIYRHQAPSDWLVLNHDNDVTRAMAQECRSQVAWFSRKAEVDRGAHLYGDRMMWVPGDGTPEDVCSPAEVRLRGVHNLENVLAAVAVTGQCGASPHAMRQVATTFTGVPHRLELVGESAGVRYYNDSIATTPTRAAAGIRAFDEPIVLIAGGYDKHLPFDEMAEAIVERVQGVVLIGVTAPMIEGAVLERLSATGRTVEIARAESFADAVVAASRMAHPGDVVLLSPGCASYDMFRNFEERGERFRSLVRELGTAS